MPLESWAVRSKHDRADSATHGLLVGAARRVFEANGFARTTIADIARDAGVGRATFYVYFASKEEVFAVVAHQLRDRLAAAQQLNDVDPEDPVAVAAKTNAAYLDAVAENLAFLTVLDHQALVDPVMNELREEIHNHPIHRTARYIERLVATGDADPATSPEAVALAAEGVTAVFARLLAREPERRDELVHHLTAMYLRLLGIDTADSHHTPKERP